MPSQGVAKASEVVAGRLSGTRKRPAPRQMSEFARSAVLATSSASAKRSSRSLAISLQNVKRFAECVTSCAIGGPDTRPLLGAAVWRKLPCRYNSCGAGVGHDAHTRYSRSRNRDLAARSNVRSRRLRPPLPISSCAGLHSIRPRRAKQPTRLAPDIPNQRGVPTHPTIDDLYLVLIYEAIHTSNCRALRALSTICSADDGAEPPRISRFVREARAADPVGLWRPHPHHQLMCAPPRDLRFVGKTQVPRQAYSSHRPIRRGLAPQP
jgi:hypothetical protein